VIVGYRFTHQLIRDATYLAMLKRGRALLHEQYADWLAAHEADRIGEVSEVIGYHVEQAHVYLQGLGPLDDHGHALAQRAASLLLDAGRRAFAREDMPAAASLSRRSVVLFAADSPDRRAAQLLLAEALDETGAYAEAAIILDDAEAAANAVGEPTSAARARLLRLRVDLSRSPDPDWASRALAEAERDLPMFDEAADLSGASLAWRVRYLAHGTTGQIREAADDAEQVIRLAVQAGDERQRLRGISNLAWALTYGPTPAAEAVESLMTLSGDVAGDRATGTVLKAALAQLHAMCAEYAVAQSLFEEARQTADDMGQSILVAQLAMDGAEVEFRAGNPARAEEILRDAAAVFERLGDTYYLATISSMLGRALLELGRVEEAAVQCDRAADLAAVDDVDAQARWRGVRAVILVAAGARDEAVEVARSGVAIARGGDFPLVTALALGDLSAALQSAGHDAEARTVRDEALAIYEAKGDRASVERLISTQS
jgi:predicted ATPase